MTTDARTLAQHAHKSGSPEERARQRYRDWGRPDFKLQFDQIRENVKSARMRQELSTAGPNERAADEWAIDNAKEILKVAWHPTSGTSWRSLAAELNAAGIATPNGGQWHVVTLQRLFDRFDRLGLISAPGAGTPPDWWGWPFWYEHEENRVQLKALGY